VQDDRKEEEGSADAVQDFPGIVKDNVRGKTVS